MKCPEYFFRVDAGRMERTGETYIASWARLPPTYLSKCVQLVGELGRGACPSSHVILEGYFDHRSQPVLS
jgi:hypothetical protein